VEHQGSKTSDAAQVWPRIIFWLGAAIAGAAIVSQAWYFNWKLDDSYISFVYARNWVEGHGVVFNVGEKVEGYTCFLWVALMALGIWLGVDVERWSTALGVASALGTVAVTGALAAELSPPRWRRWAIVPVLCLAFWPPLSWWAASGMETTLFTFLPTLAVWWHIRTRAVSLLAPVTLALAAMTRPEGWLLSAILCLDALRQRGTRGLAYIASFTAVFAPYFAWRTWYYGYLLPNTFYAKVGASDAQLWRGVKYLKLFLADWGAVLLLSAVVYFFAAMSQEKHRGGSDVQDLAGQAARFHLLLPVYLFLACYCVYVVVVGGDIFHFHRFWVPIVPLLTVLMWAAVVCGLSSSRRKRFATVALAMLAVWWNGNSAIGALRAQQPHVRKERFLLTGSKATGRCLRGRAAPEDAIAAIGIGALRYYSERSVIDMLGLTDLHIAREVQVPMGQGLAGHEKYDSQYVLSRRPRYICVPEENRPSMVPAHRDLWRQPEFRERYERGPCGCYELKENFRQKEKPDQVERAN
jgi:MFS family permease